MTAYTKEFEKWLSTAKNETDMEDDEEDEDPQNSHQFHDNENDDGDTTGEDSSQGSFVELKTAEIVVPCEKAPILVDDDDLSDNDNQFEDEPPILEPVQKQPASRRISKTGDGKHSGPMRNYSRNNQTYSRQRSLQEHQSLAKSDSKEKLKPTLSDDYEKRQRKSSVKSKESKESGNIFDKFMSEQYDSPPPLIPSPEALRLTSEVQVSETKNQGSPDFCAMEADSTSEIISDSCVSHSQPKNYGDLLECDSTCMLGASPVTVSPASVSNIECEEVRDSGGGICNDGSVDTAKMATGEDNIAKSLCAPANDKLSSGVKSFYPDQSPGITPTFHKEVNIDIDNLEPPTLTVISPLLSSPIVSRRKRHTIDTPETYSRMSKRRTLNSPTLEQEDISSPPLLKNSKELTAPISQLEKKTQAERSSHYPKRQRCHTVPSDHPHHLESLDTFVANTLKLSTLQTRMHALLKQLFPQIRQELDSISPESLGFTDLMHELVLSLQHTHKPPLPESLAPTPCKDTPPEDSSQRLSSPPGSFKAASSDACDELMRNSHRSYTSSKANCDSKQRKGGCHTTHKKHNTDEPAGGDLGISKLSLKDQLESIRPAQVILSRDPASVQLDKFIQISCKALQLLLPDVAVSLKNELAFSPQDLLVFIDNVILFNSRKRL
ncbi:uncharacterized protein LOC131941118 [Physella acuta]|uniref:uncharacterized protein LOC131941118 n=1 Tax=Physella acuta TaxID=109671 RepID=UPI0027DAE819|nr:uncharacterized protein LOC131941118 [Physella acuta]